MHSSRRQVLVAVLIACGVCLVSAACARSSAGEAPASNPAVSADKGKAALTLTLASPAFVSEEQAADATVNTGEPASMPPRFAMRSVPGGHNTSIPYVWRSAPLGTRSFALTLIDTAPVARNWVHWMVVDMPADSSALREAASGGSAMPTGALELRNSFGAVGYGGPQPPIGTGAHSYVATLYALDVDRLALSSAAATRDDVLRAIDGHVLATATCTGAIRPLTHERRRPSVGTTPLGCAGLGG